MEPNRKIANPKKVVYYWYDHLVCRSNGDAEIVEKAIKEHDLKTFLRIRDRYERMYPDTKFFPDTAAVFDGDERVGDILITNKNGFDQITRSEYECG